MAGLGFIVPRSRHSGDRLALSAHRNCWKITLGWIGVARVGFKCQQQLFLWPQIMKHELKSIITSTFSLLVRWRSVSRPWRRSSSATLVTAEEITEDSSAAAALQAAE